MLWVHNIQLNTISDDVDIPWLAIGCCCMMYDQYTYTCSEVNYCQMQNNSVMWKKELRPDAQVFLYWNLCTITFWQLHLSQRQATKVKLRARLFFPCRFLHEINNMGKGRRREEEIWNLQHSKTFTVDAPRWRRHESMHTHYVYASIFLFVRLFMQHNLKLIKFNYKRRRYN